MDKAFKTSRLDTLLVQLRFLLIIIFALPVVGLATCVLQVYAFCLDVCAGSRQVLDQTFDRAIIALDPVI